MQRDESSGSTDEGVGLPGRSRGKPQRAQDGDDNTPSRLVRRLRPQPTRRIRAVSFTGLLGDSDRPGHVRLYVDPELRSWLEVADEDIVHRETLDAPAGTPGGGTVLWVKRGAPVGHGGRSARVMQRELLEGEIIRRYLPDTVTDEQVEAFASTMICATIAITWQLCVTPSCEDITVPLICDGDDDDDDDGDDDDGDTPDDTGDDEPETETPEG